MNLADFLLKSSRHLTTDCIIEPPHKITYQKLWSDTLQLATLIIQHFGTHQEIILLANRSIFFAIAYLAILKSGNRAVIIPADISTHDLHELIKKYKFSVCFCQAQLITKIPSSVTALTETDLKDLPPARSHFPQVSTQDVAVIIFTSGSTGGKKGVMLTHENLSANATSIITFQQLTSKDRIAVVLPFFYIFGLSLLNTHLRVGGSLVLHQGVFLGSVITEINHYHCTGLAGVAATYQILIQETNFLREPLPSLRYMSHSGGTLADEYIKRLLQAFANKQIFMMFGVTEASPRLMFVPPQLLPQKIGSVGKAIPKVKVEVVNQHQQPIKPGQLGEIRVQGPNIMLGYYQDKHSTNAVLKNGWLYTGDIATIDMDGFVYIKGRKTNIIKAAGHRISSEEVALILAKIPHVKNCYVFGVPDPMWGESVAAIIETTQQITAFKKKIIATCTAKLPSYKVPRFLTFTRQLPLNSSHKLDSFKIKTQLTDLIIKQQLPAIVKFS